MAGLQNANPFETLTVDGPEGEEYLRQD